MRTIVFQAHYVQNFNHPLLPQKRRHQRAHDPWGPPRARLLAQGHRDGGLRRAPDGGHPQPQVSPQRLPGGNQAGGRWGQGWVGGARAGTV